MPTARLASLLTLLALLAGALLPGLSAADFTPGDLVVYRVGDGSAALTSSGTAIFIDEYSPAGILVQSIPLPTATSGANHRIVSGGTATSEGQLTISSDSHLIVVTGYDAALATSGLSGSASSSVPRVVGLVDSHGTIDTSTDLTDAATGNNPRSATSDGTGNLWFAGAAGGLRFATVGATTSTQLTTTTNVSVAEIFQGQLYVSSAKNDFIAAIGSGLPTSGTPTATDLPFTASPVPNAFVLVHLGSTGSAPDTLYEADNLATINKYSLVSGSWAACGSYALANVTGLTATVASGSVTLYATAGTVIATVTDASGYDATATGTLGTLATASANTALRGIGLAPLISPPVITSATTLSGQVSSAFTYQITATNTPTSFNATGLPAGLSVDTTTGIISGSPTGTGTSSIALSATNAGGTGTATLSLTINVSTVPVISSAATDSSPINIAYSYQIAASNSPTSYGASSLPTGLSIDTTSGLISGTPTVSGVFTIPLSATNGSGTGTASLTLTVTATPPVISGPTTASGQVGVAFSYQIQASQTPTSYGASGLPAGVSVNTATGLISGTPTATGVFTVALSATSSGGTGTASLALTIHPPSPAIFSTPFISTPVGSALELQVLASNTPTAYAATGLPAGLTINATSGLISGTPTAAGTATVTVSASNSGGAGTQTLVIVVTPVEPVVTSPLSASGSVGTAFSYQVLASNAPTAYAATGLPAGLSIATATGAITGTPTTAGTTSVTLSASNASGTGTAVLSLTIATATTNGTAGTTPAAPASSSSSSHCGLGGGIALLLLLGLGLRRRPGSDRSRSQPQAER